jgi:tRNA(adenine34) deaminase
VAAPNAFMKRALELAQEAMALGEVPVGAVVVCDGQIVGQGYNRREIDHDPLAHAELLAIKEASQKLGRWRLNGCTLYVTLEPCPMCAGALVNARVDEVVFGAFDQKAGAVMSVMELCTDNHLNHQMKATAGVMGAESAQLLKDFFLSLRT